MIKCKELARSCTLQTLQTPLVINKHIDILKIKSMDTILSSIIRWRNKEETTLYVKCDQDVVCMNRKSD